uniref:Uncharacterized protein n=1 Tax=Lotharella oceanica TaxID=641309 RepID=A0A7S2TLV4_9EUKA|mmetsp:Transcript_20273/g.38140  ORF Transcript_20273/g.38140 Transcript_20273/m.38140 type:complete len:275 (+) Transcript_20273:1-825(+)
MAARLLSAPRCLRVLRIQGSCWPSRLPYTWRAWEYFQDNTTNRYFSDSKSEKSSYDEFWEREYKKREEAKERQKEGREKLEKEMQRSKLQDHYDLAKHKGKVGAPDPELTPFDKSVRFPSIRVEALDGTESDILDFIDSKVTLVFFYGSAMAMRYGQEWIDGTKSVRERLKVDVIEVSLNESWYSQILKPLSKWGLKSSVPPERQSRFFCVYNSISPQKEKLNLINSLTANVLLLDDRGAVRWKSTGSPDDRELKMLEEFIPKIRPKPPIEIIS